jgi:hypothetical protein
MENFVTYDLAVKLKAKGFKQGFNIFGYKLVFSDENTIKYISDIGAYEKNYFGINIPCPAISQVLKWLREEKKIHLIVEISDSGWYYTLYPNVRWENDKLKSDKYIMSFKHKASYEEAYLAGITWALDNLI